MLQNGKIGKGKSFFYKAFGNDEEEFHKLLYMPETYILFRFFFEKEGYTEKWHKCFDSLTAEELSEAKGIIEKNDFKNIEAKFYNKKIKELLKHYTITRTDIENSNTNISKLKKKFDVLENVEKYGIFELA